MRAIVYEKYGSPDVLELKEVEKPQLADDGVLVRVRAASINPADWYAMAGPWFARLQSGLRKPKQQLIGADFAGTAEAVGKEVTDFRPGDEVFGARTGALGDYVCVRVGVAKKPANVTFEQAAAVPVAGLTVLQGLRDIGQVQAGQKVLINGASGGVGTLAVQIAKAFGAEVTGVCSTRNVDIVRSIGADHVIDYTYEDFTRSDRRYDLFFDGAGSRSWSEVKRILNPQSAVVMVGAPKAGLMGPLGHIIKFRLAAIGSSQKVGFFIAKVNKADMEVLRELLETGKVTPVIDRRYELSEVADAFRYLEEGHAQGKIVIAV